MSLISVAAAIPAIGHLGYAAAPLALGHTASMAIAGPAIAAYPAAYPAAYGYATHGPAPAGLGGHGFGHGGHFSPMPMQEVRLVGVPQPYPVAQPIPVDKPYAVPGKSINNL